MPSLTVHHSDGGQRTVLRDTCGPARTPATRMVSITRSHENHPPDQAHEASLDNARLAAVSSSGILRIREVRSRLEV